MTNFDESFSKELEKAPGSKDKERPTEEEALLYQEYATESERLEFSKQASPEANKEAGALIEQLRNKNPEFADIKRIDLRNPEELASLQERIRNYIDSKSEKEEIPKRRTFLNGASLAAMITLALALSEQTDLAAGAEIRGRGKKIEQIKGEEQVEMKGLEYGSLLRPFVEEWLIENGVKYTKVIVEYFENKQTLDIIVFPQSGNAIVSSYHVKKDEEKDIKEGMALERYRVNKALEVFKALKK